MTPSGQPQVTFQWSNDPAAVEVAAVNQTLILNFLAPGAANGYLWANSDRGLSSAPSSNHLTRLTTLPIDCSEQGTVLFTMRSTIGVWANDASQYCKLRVSNDGLEWTDFSPFPCLTAGGDITPPCSRFSYNPQFVAVDITTVAANQPAVYLQLQWQGGWEYYWAIDDLALSSVPENDLVLDFGYTVQVGGGYEYGRIPQSQMPPSMEVGAQVVSFGSGTQTNVAVNISLIDPDGGVVASTNSPIGTMYQNDTVLVEAVFNLPDPMAVGRYTTQFTVGSDQSELDEDPANNHKHRYFEVTELLYSIDAVGVVPDSMLVVSQTGTTSFIDNTMDLRFLAYYEMRSAAHLDGVEVALGGNTQPGSFLVGELFAANQVFSGNMSSPLAASDFRFISQGDLTTGVVYAEFLDPVFLLPGDYYVSATLYQEDGNNIYVLDDLTVPQPNDASMIWLPVDDEGNHLYVNGTAWSVRLRMTDITDRVPGTAGLGDVTIWPNPSSGSFQVIVPGSGPVSVEVFDMLGSLVHTSQPNGTILQVDLGRDRPAGIYTIRAGRAGRYSVQRVAIH